MLVSFLNTVNFDKNEIKSYIPNINYGKVVKVYDGDTITIITTLQNDGLVLSTDLYKFNVRILGIDTPELKSKNAVEHELGILARNSLSELIMDKVVRLENVSYDKYGRILCHVFLDEINVSEWLVSKNHAVLYNGGKKVKKWY